MFLYAHTLADCTRGEHVHTSVRDMQMQRHTQLRGRYNINTCVAFYVAFFSYRGNVGHGWSRLHVLRFLKLVDDVNNAVS